LLNLVLINFIDLLFKLINLFSRRILWHLPPQLTYLLLMSVPLILTPLLILLLHLRHVRLKLALPLPPHMPHSRIELFDFSHLPCIHCLYCVDVFRLFFQVFQLVFDHLMRVLFLRQLVDGLIEIMQILLGLGFVVGVLRSVLHTLRVFYLQR